jgi:hypothetical protein
MAIFAAPLEMNIGEGLSDIGAGHLFLLQFQEFLNVKRILLIIVIQISIIMSSDVKKLALLLTRNALLVTNMPVIFYNCQTNAIIMEVVLAHSCQEEAPHAIRIFITE